MFFKYKNSIEEKRYCTALKMNTIQMNASLRKQKRKLRIKNPTFQKWYSFKPYCKVYGIDHGCDGQQWCERIILFCIAIKQNHCRFGVGDIDFQRYKLLLMRASLFFLSLLKSIDLKSRQKPLGKDERTRLLLQRIILDRAKHFESSWDRFLQRGYWL